MIVCNIDWPAFLARHDLTWTDIGEQWEQGAFLGNGMLGAMIYKDASGSLRWEMGRSDVTAHFQIPMFDWADPRLPIGDFLLSPVGNVRQEQMRLDLWNAEARGEIVTDRGVIRWRSLIHSVDMGLLIEVRAEGEEIDADLSFRPKHGVSPCLEFYEPVHVSREWLKAHTPPEPVVSCEGGIHCAVQDLLAGGDYATAWTEQRDGDGTRRLWATVANSWPRKGAASHAIQTVRDIAAKDVDGWIESHRAWWHDYFPRSFVSISDPYWESFYWIQMYKIASATRSDRALIDSQGPWLTSTPWPTCVWNLNVQLSYWPLLTSNRGDLGESLYTKLDDSIATLRMNVPDLCRRDALGIGRASSCVDLNSRTSAGWETGNLTWVCHNYFRHYRCCMDQDMLRDRLYPMLRGAVNFYFYLMEREDDGTIHLLPTHSPEYGQGTTRDANYDLALLRWGCATLLSLAERLGIEDERIPDWRDVLEHLTPPPVDESGLRVGRDTPFDKSHRHFSHLFSIFPLGLLQPEIEEERELAKRSIEHWLSLDDELQGYTFLAASCMYSRFFHDGDRALDLLNQLKDYIQPNTMYKENGPVIETPLAATESIHDMLLQSHTDPNRSPVMQSVIKVFIATPKAWDDVVFHNLRAEGAFLVSASRADGITQWIRITSEAGERCLIMTDLKQPVQVEGARRFDITPRSGGIFEIDLKAGETIVIADSSDIPDLTVKPVPHVPGATSNIFGMPSDTVPLKGGRPAH
ncbi:MAG: hypothetical protein D6698_16985 [Gammaproteobacteria bacterium]|nr:MAG: hypothetical protein D6698_16985 [Gammaproteobacteria bacterium]